MCEDVWKMKRATIVIMIFVLMASMLQTLTACLGWPVEQGRTTTGITGLWQPSVHSDVAF